MKLTKIGQDIITISEKNLNDLPSIDQKVHLIRLFFDYPDNDKMEWVITSYPRTRRFVIDTKNIRFYNSYFKRTNIKYYVINTNSYYSGLISFFKRNNKVLLDVTILQQNEKDYIFSSLVDVLSNLEVIMISKDDFDEYSHILSEWNGNVIIKNGDCII